MPSALNARGGPGYRRDLQTELVLLGASNFVGEDDFHESGLQRDDRFAALVHEAALSDPEWTVRWLQYLRGTLHMRSAPLVGAAEFVKARADNRIQDAGRNPNERGLGRIVIDRVCQRADEPGELMGYWLSHYGRRMPAPFKRGLADAANRLYHGKSLLSYDSDRRAVRFGDVIELTHPRPRSGRLRNLDGREFTDHERDELLVRQRQEKSDLFRAAIDRRHNRPDVRMGTVTTLRLRAELMSIPVQQRRAVLSAPDAVDRLKDAAMSWEALAGWLQGPLDAQAWSVIVPSMGYMARLRNLNNFDRKGLPDDLAEQVATELCEPENVATSRQLPMRFLSAYRAVNSLRWSWSLEKALDLCLSAITPLDKKTLVLIDTSQSMNVALSKRGTLKRQDAAVLFGLAVARRCQWAEVVSFSNRYWGSPPHRLFLLRQGESLLRALSRWEQEGYFINGGTDTVGALRTYYTNHDRVIIVTDEQCESSEQGVVSQAVPASVPLYTWNLAGYRYGHAPSGTANRFTIGGLNDAAFSMIPILEKRQDAGWPF